MKIWKCFSYIMKVSLMVKQVLFWRPTRRVDSLWKVLKREKRMNTEEIFYHTLRLIVVLGTILILGGVWKYLNKKPLGMQTLFDLMIQDLIIATFMKTICSQLVLFKFVQEYPYYLAFVLVYFDYISVWVFFLQIFVTVLIR